MGRHWLIVGEADVAGLEPRFLILLCGRNGGEYFPMFVRGPRNGHVVGKRAFAFVPGRIFFFGSAASVS